MRHRTTSVGIFWLTNICAQAWVCLQKLFDDNVHRPVDRIGHMLYDHLKNRWIPHMCTFVFFQCAPMFTQVLLSRIIHLVVTTTGTDMRTVKTSQLIKSASTMCARVCVHVHCPIHHDKVVRKQLGELRTSKACMCPGLHT